MLATAGGVSVRGERGRRTFAVLPAAQASSEVFVQRCAWSHGRGGGEGRLPPARAKRNGLPSPAADGTDLQDCRGPVSVTTGV